jgi:hemolysin activation/secretion protein
MSRELKYAGHFAILFVMLALLRNPAAMAEEEVPMFTIENYIVKGNTLLPYERIENAMRYYTGENKTAADIEAARTYLEGLYHQEGYPTVLVNIPPQEVADGVVALEVIESTVGEVRVTGNRYYTREKILGRLPVFRPGSILFLPEYQQQLNKINRGADLKVDPVLMPGKELGTTDVELKVTDNFPFHGSLELNNRNTHDTKPLRLNAILHYDNLWQSEHSLTLQYQASPQKLDEVKAGAVSYVLPAPWNDDNLLIGYGVLSDSNSAFGEGFRVIGKGEIYGLMYVMPLPFYKLYAHNFSLGADYKHFDQNIGFEDGTGELKSPVTYLLFSAQYRSSLEDTTGTTQFEAGLRTSFNGFVTRGDDFSESRFKGQGSFLVTTYGITRTQKLPEDVGLFLRFDGQQSDRPLISNEQYIAGGMASVRGYHENEASGDNAAHATMELRAPDMAKFTKLPRGSALTPFIFFDAARLSIDEPLPGQAKHDTLGGAGFGMRGSVGRYLDYEIDYGVALRDTDQTDKGDTMVHFSVKGQF